MHTFVKRRPLLQIGIGDEVFSEWLAGGLRYFKQLWNGGPPGSASLEAENREGGGITRP
jgi:hypothetical protein